MTDQQQTIAAALDRLFRTYPSSGQGDSAGAVLRERIERIKVYFEAVGPYGVSDIESAVSNFLTGTAPGHNPAFAPAAPQLAAECRRVQNLRLDRLALVQRLRPMLPPPDIEHTPESRERIRALAQQAIGSLDAPAEERDAATAETKARWSKVNARFAPDMTEDAVAERLMGYRVGNDVEGEAA